MVKKKSKKIKLVGAGPQTAQTCFFGLICPLQRSKASLVDSHNLTLPPAGVYIPCVGHITVYIDFFSFFLTTFFVYNCGDQACDPTSAEVATLLVKMPSGRPYPRKSIEYRNQARSFTILRWRACQECARGVTGGLHSVPSKAGCDQALLSGFQAYTQPKGTNKTAKYNYTTTFNCT